MSNITGLTRDGTEWIPAFIMGLNQNDCIGCGRCFKVCPRDVFELVDREVVEGLECDGDEDYDDFSDDTSMVMSLKNIMDCIGCEACYRMCTRKCMSHQPQPLNI